MRVRKRMFYELIDQIELKIQLNDLEMFILSSE